ncbi:MAG TPA: hypothetical protein VK638_36990 [Edaphobacter sp.]|nr:hypothetical protein [Edaphobacter sp.]
MRASETDLFKGRHFDQEVIILCVRWYLSYKLSSRDLAQMMEERGIEGTHDDFAIGAAVRPGIRETLEPLRTNGWRVVALRGDLYKR